MIPAERRNSVATFEIEATFIITGRGLVMAGRIIEGHILRGDIIEFSANAFLRQRKVNLVTAMRKLPPTDSDIGIVIECFNKEEMEELKNWNPNKANATVYRAAEQNIEQKAGVVDFSKTKKKWWKKIFK